MLEDGSNGAGKRPSHILQIIGNAIVGGMESYVGNLISHLPAERYRVTCICPYESAYTTFLRRLGCNVFITPLRDDPPWRSIEMGVEFARQQNVDLIHAHLPNAHALAGVVGRLTGKPVVATIHSMTLQDRELSISRLTGTRLIVVCQETYAHGLAAGVPADRMTLIPNGVDTDTFAPRANGDEFRKRIGAPLDAPLIGFVGRLSHEKGPDKFVQVAGRVHYQRPDAHFVIVGEGQLEDSLLNMIRRMGLEDKVHMTGLRSDTPDIYPSFDIFVQTSRSEAMPLAILEAMSCGCPVVAIAVGGVAELVEAGTTGILLSPGDWPGVATPYPGDWEGVASAVLELLDHPDRLKRMGRASRARAEEFFDLRKAVRLTTDLFDRLLLPGGERRDLWSTIWPFSNPSEEVVSNRSPASN